MLPTQAVGEFVLRFSFLCIDSGLLFILVSGSCQMLVIYAYSVDLYAYCHSGG